MLQNINKHEVGYIVDMSQDYCQRCFRLSHYGDQMISLKHGIDPKLVIDKLSSEKGILAWVVDITNFEEAFIPKFSTIFKDKTILLVVTKSDLLNDLLTPEKCMAFIQDRCQSLHIPYDGIVVSGQYGPQEIRQIKSQLKTYAHGKTIIFAGKANAGKSSFINALMGNNDLTTSRYPGTTVDFNPIQIEEGFNIIDTPGIEGSHSVIMEADEKDLKVICPTKPIHAKVFQLTSSQSYCIGGLAKVDIIGATNASLVIYISNLLQIHRTKYLDSDKLWNKHKGNLFIPTLKGKEKVLEYPSFKAKKDIVIAGLGWFSVIGDYQQIRLTVNENVYVSVRKAMI